MARLIKVLTTYRAQPFDVDHFEGKSTTKTTAGYGDICRIGKQCGIAATDELESTSFQNRYNLLVNKDANPVDGGVYADGVTPVYMQHNRYEGRIRNVDAGDDAPIGTPIFYYDDPTDALAANTINVVVGATAAADALVGVLRQSIAAGATVNNAQFETVNQVPLTADALTPIAL